MGLGACRRERKELGEMGESELDNSRIGRAGQVRDGLQMLDSLGRETEGTGEFGHDNHRRAYREKRYIRDTYAIREMGKTGDAGKRIAIVAQNRRKAYRE